MGDEAWFDIAHGDKSLYIASWDIYAVMFEGFQGNLNIANDGIDGVRTKILEGGFLGSEGFKWEVPIIVFFYGFLGFQGGLVNRSYNR